MEIHVVTFVLNLDQFFQQFIPAILIALMKENMHGLIRRGRTDAVDAGHRGDDNDIPPRQQTARCRMTHLVDLVVNGGIFFNEGVTGRNVCFRLVIIVVGHKIFDGIMWKKLLELAIQLSCQSFVGSQHQCRATGTGDDVGHRKCFAGTGNTQQGLVAVAALNTGDQLFNSQRLVTPRGVCCGKLK